MKAVIISGGDCPSYNLLKEELQNCKLLIAADKGIEMLLKHNISPNLVVGDFDSIDKKIFKKLDKENFNVEKFPPEKDYTDTLIAVNRAINFGVDEIVLLGCTGNRLDHVIGNVGILYKCLQLNIRCTIKDNNSNIELVNKPTVIKSRHFPYISLLSYGKEVKKLTIKGAKYPLHEYDLKLGDSIGISNEFKKDEIKIEFDDGLLLIIQSKD
ncbi:thiamine diphosphokinase [Clostridium rectalis]|uniref:thiamine diphosphokinase n=1 Tax=Clostridium rectalis TaxID=2040295 RepID=UPI000F6326CA|nr:thiamine diphosphokinase [Clostridium rectalis]